MLCRRWREVGWEEGLELGYTIIFVNLSQLPFELNLGQAIFMQKEIDTDEREIQEVNPSKTVAPPPTAATAE